MSIFADLRRRAIEPKLWTGFILQYRVFVSHGWHDRWVAGQIAENIRRDCGADVFIDIFDVRSGDRIEDKVRIGLTSCKELVCLLAPWSVSRNWVCAEMAGAWIFRSAMSALPMV